MNGPKHAIDEQKARAMIDEAVLRHHDGTMSDDPYEACFARIAKAMSITMGEWSLDEIKRGTPQSAIVNAAVQVGTGAIAIGFAGQARIPSELRQALHKQLDNALDCELKKRT